MVTLATDNPSGFLAAIKKEIDNKKMETWIYDKDGDFLYTPEQWKGKAYFTPSLGKSILTFKLNAYKNKAVDLYTAAVYHGRFIEILSAHFPADFTHASSEVKAIDASA